MPTLGRMQELEFDPPRGIHRAADPEEIGGGLVYDLVNVRTNDPYGAVRPRLGTRTLACRASTKTGGHPINPLGNASFDGTAEILRLIEDEARRRLYAIVKTGTDRARVYLASTAEARPGFDTVNPSAEFDLDTNRPPSVELYQGRLIVAAGVTGANQNIAFDAETGATVDTQPDPKQVDIASLTIVASSTGVMECSFAYYYKFVYLNSTTGAESMASSAKTLAAFTGKKVITVGGASAAGIPGADDKTVWDRIRIYRTTDGGTVFRYLDEIDNPGKGSFTTYLDATTDDKLSYRQLPARHGRVPTTRFCLAHNDRMLYAVQTEPPFDGSIVYYSEPYAPFNVDPTYNFVSVRPDDGGVITLLLRLYNRVYVVKSNGAIYELIDLRPNGVYGVDPLVNEGPWGCVSAASYREIQGVAYWLAYGGWCRFAGDGLPSIVSLPIQAELTAVKPVMIHRTATETTSYGEVTTAVFDVANNDVCRETFQFYVRLFTSTQADPGAGSPTAVFSTDTALDLPLFRVNDRALAAITGYPLAAPGSASVRLTLHKWHRQTLTVNSTGAHWHVDWKGQTGTIELANAATSAAVQAALEALSTVGAGNVVVGTRSGAGPYTYPVAFNIAAGGLKIEDCNAAITATITGTFTAAGYHALEVGTTYYAYAKCNDGLEDSAWKLLDLGAGAVGGSTKTYEEWSPASKAFAVDYPDRNEVWVFTPDIDGRINQAWVLDYQTLQADTGPQWRRHKLHATAGCHVRNLSGGGGEDFSGLILGDSLGCIWQHPYAGGDFEPDYAADLATPAGVGTLSLALGAWTLTDATAAWPAPGTGEPGLKGTRVAIAAETAAGWESWTGIVTGNTATVLTIGFWIGPPPPDAAVAAAFVVYALGGIEAYAEYYLAPLTGPNETKQVKRLFLRTSGETGAADILAELRWSERSAALDAQFAATLGRKLLTTTRTESKHVFPLGGVRARFVGAKIGTWDREQTWLLSGWGVEFIPTGAGR